MGRCRLGMRLALCALSVLLSGCATNPLDRIRDEAVSRSPALRRAAVKLAGECPDPDALGVVIDALEADDEIRAAAAHALILRGREWERGHGRTNWTKANPVIAAVGETAAKVHLDGATRAKAVWVLGEIGSRKAKDAIAGAYGDDSMAVQHEQARARDKLGFTGTAVAYEVLR